MNFDFGSIFNISTLIGALIGAISGSLLTHYFNNKRNKIDLCIKVYERWISDPLYKNRSKALKKLQNIKTLKDERGCGKAKLSELHYLSRGESPSTPKDFLDNFFQVMIFFADLNKLMKSELIDVGLSRTMFKDTILPWFQYLDLIEFDSIEGIEYSFDVIDINSLSQKLNEKKHSKKRLKNRIYSFFVSLLKIERTV